MALLHLIVKNYPEAIYYYLLASTYYESGEAELALQYADTALTVDSDYKEAYELKGLIYEKEENYPQAEQMYLKALMIDPDFMTVREHLIDIYFFKQERYEDTIVQCNLFPDKYKFEAYKEKAPRFLTWTTLYKARMSCSYIYLKNYREAIKVINEYIEVIHFYFGEKEEYTLSDEDAILYKLYYLLKDRDGLARMKKKWKEYYEVGDKYLYSMEKDAEQGYINDDNDDNYTIAPDGTVITKD